MTYTVSGVALIALWLFFVFMPHQRQDKTAREQIKQTRLQLADFERIRTELPAFLAMSKNLGSAKSGINSQLYAKDDILKLFNQFQQRAREHNIEITEIKPSVEELLQLNSMIPSASQPLFISIDLRFKGGFADFGRFVSSLEKDPYFRGIISCQIISSETGLGGLSQVLAFKALLGNLGANS